MNAIEDSARSARMSVEDFSARMEALLDYAEMLEQEERDYYEYEALIAQWG